MVDSSPDYKQLFFEEKNRNKAAEIAQNEAEQGRAEEQRRREEEEEKPWKMTLPEFLDACHNHLHLGLAVQKDASQSTQGNSMNANNKLRPQKRLGWVPSVSKRGFRML